jgi:hypothetical protein
MKMSDNTMFTLLSAVTDTGASSGFACATAGAQVHVYSAAGSSCTVLIQGSQNNSVWKTLATLTDPSAAPDGNVFQGTAMPFMRANVSARVSGTITATMIALDKDPGDWASILQAAPSLGEVTVTQLTDSGLTATRIPYAGTAGLLVDEAALTYTAGTNTLTAGTFTGAFSGSTVTASSLTATRVPYAGTAGLLGDDAAFTFTTASGILDVTDLRASGLTATRVPFAGTAGLIGDSSAFTHVSGLTTSTIFGGAHKDTIAAKLIDGAISSAPGTIAITKATPLGSSTLATPTVTTHDGYILRITSTTAQAHVVSCASGKVNGGTTTTLTFGGAIGDSIVLVAYQGVWYSVANTNVTLS